MGIVAAVGFIDATYLTIEHYMNAIPPCAVGNCEVVLTSVYSVVPGTNIPAALVGALYYLLIVVLVIVLFDLKKDGQNEKLRVLILRKMLSITVFGFLASLWFLYLQAFVLHAYCQYCLVSAATSTILFAIAVYSMKKWRPSDQTSTLSM